eukprot:899379-Rhodomonas_salina.1
MRGLRERAGAACEGVALAVCVRACVRGRARACEGVWVWVPVVMDLRDWRVYACVLAGGAGGDGAAGAAAAPQRAARRTEPRSHGPQGPRPQPLALHLTAR